MRWIGGERTAMTTTSLAPLLKPEELAAHWSVTRSYVYKLMAERGLPSVKIGAARRIRLSDAEAWLEENQESTSAGGGLRG
jgi:excisionase family DNA binding protein